MNCYRSIAPLSCVALVALIVPIYPSLFRFACGNVPSAVHRRTDSSSVSATAFCATTGNLSAFASQSILPPPPLSVPVWSLACPLSDTDASRSSDTSMSIVTFATPASVAPPKLWAVSLYRTSLTGQAFLNSGRGVLQLLNPHQSALVPILGKRSGHEAGFSKGEECERLGSAWVPGGGAAVGSRAGSELLLPDRNGR